ncbi:NAD(P)-dependent oxidoreductase [Nocardia uniformis]|uniref:NAD(P)-dependent oxidoreductase n=1 Tax=Nocardia uniformis TaxID=53432 RepID=A0A849CAL7_9NOCA|nr:NAD(P)-dependent oxidoreductase [Nocardia uniformis]NNH73325.1 NAD(P)-dependent oxidoreductase [Nocardia uniformis]
MGTAESSERPLDAAEFAVGFIGLGNMGAPMAQRLLKWPGGLVVCDMRPEVLEPFTSGGATTADTAAEVAERCGVVSVAVLDDAQVRSVVTGPNGILHSAKPGTVIAVHSTIADQTAVALAAECAERGVEFVDAPVSGGAPAAKKGGLAVMVGGTEGAFATVRSPFELWASLIVHAGEVGAGTRMKLARNLLHFIAFTAASEAQRLAEAAELDITELGKVVRHSDSHTGGAGSIMLRNTTAPVEPDDFWFPILTHVRDLGEKDLSLALDLGRRLGVPLPLAEQALDGLGAGLGVGPGDISKEQK